MTDAHRHLIQLKDPADYGSVLALKFTGFYFSLKKKPQKVKPFLFHIVFKEPGSPRTLNTKMFPLTIQPTSNPNFSFSPPALQAFFRSSRAHLWEKLILIIHEMLACLLSHYCCSDLFEYECVTDKSSSERRWILSLITFTHSDFKWKLLNYYHMIMNWDSTQKLSLQLNKTCKMMHFSATSWVLYGEYLSERPQFPTSPLPTGSRLLFRMRQKVAHLDFILMWVQAE